MGRVWSVVVLFAALLALGVGVPAAPARTSSAPAKAKAKVKAKVCVFRKGTKVVRKPCHAKAKPATSSAVTPARPSVTTSAASVTAAADPDLPAARAGSALVAASASVGTPATGGGSTSGGGTSPPPASGGATRTPSAPSIGVVAGSAPVWELPMLATLGAHHARVEFDISSTVAQLTPVIDAYARAGVQVLPLAAFNGRLPTADEAHNLASWAAAFGPGGTFWLAHTAYASSLAVPRIEFGNETNQSWQWPQISGDPNWAATTFYAGLARTYALRFRDAAQAIAAANARVALLAIADTPGNWQQWADNLFAAVPDFASYVGGWVTHPYGPGWASAVDAALATMHAHGAPDSLPLYVTELGIATDDGRCLGDNYGWDRCLSYSAAGTALTGVVAGLRARYGTRLAEVDLYSARDLSAHAASSDREQYFGGTTSTGGAKGAFTSAVQALLASGS